MVNFNKRRHRYIIFFNAITVNYAKAILLSILVNPNWVVAVPWGPAFHYRVPERCKNILVSS